MKDKGERRSLVNSLSEILHYLWITWLNRSRDFSCANIEEHLSPQLG